MAIPDSPIPPGLMPEMVKITHALQASSVATLTAAIVSAAGRPFSIKEVMEISRNLHFAMHPAPQYGAYQEWVKTRDAALDKVWG
jgi:hypothetical protein